MNNNINQLQEEYYILGNKISLKNKRNLILNETDKYMLSDYPITPDNLEIIKTYRQNLRDFTQNNFILPDKPDFINILNS